MNAQGVRMWNKDQSPAPPSPPSPGPLPEMMRPASPIGVIGELMRIKGEVYSVDELRLDGEIEGRLELQNRLTIGPKGKAEANIKATEVDVAGSVKGNVEASQRIFLRKGAQLVGDVKTAGIVIEDGAYFKGGIDIARPEGAPS